MLILDIIGGLLAMPGLILLGFWIGLRRAGSQSALTAGAPDKALGGTHRLVKVFTDVGWWYKCSCGRQQPVYPSGVTNRYDSTEAKALNAWKTHAGLYKGLTGLASADQTEIDRLRAELKKQQDACFCKDL